MRWIRILGALLAPGALLVASTAQGQTTIFSESFDGGVGQFSASGNVYTGEVFTGTAGVRLRGGSGAGAVTSPAISTVGFTDVVLRFERATDGSLDSGEFGIAEVSLDGGATFTVVEATQGGASAVSFPLGAGAAGQSSVVLRFRIAASSFFEDFEIDNVVLEGAPDGGGDDGGGDDGGGGELGASGSYLEGSGGATTPDSFSFTNTGDADIATLAVDLGPGAGDPIFDPSDVPFAATSSDAVGFSGSFALDGGSILLELDFSDFNPGETFSFQADLDDTGGLYTTGAEVAGSTLTVSAPDQADATGTFEADASDENQANVTAGADGGGDDGGGDGGDGNECTGLFDTNQMGPCDTTQDLGAGPDGESGLHMPVGDGPFPVFVWGAGAGAGPSDYVDHMNYAASHGFISLSEVSTSTGSEFIDGLDWLEAQNSDPSSPLFGKVDLTRIAIGGHSRGSISAFEAADDPRVDTTLHVAGGSFDGNGPDNLSQPTAYICGEDDASATANCEQDYANTTVPVFFTIMANVGHIEAAREGLPASTAWLLWQLVGEDRADQFLDPNGEFQTGIWDSQAKNF